MHGVRVWAWGRGEGPAVGCTFDQIAFQRANPDFVAPLGWGAPLYDGSPPGVRSFHAKETSQNSASCDYADADAALASPWHETSVPIMSTGA